MKLELRFKAPTSPSVEGISSVLVMQVDAFVTPDPYGPADAAVFMYRRAVTDDDSDVFQEVCSAPNMIYLPASRAVVPPGGLYRRASCTLAVLSLSELRDVREGIQAGGQVLVNDWSRMHSTLTTTMTVTLEPGSVLVNPVVSPEDAAVAVAIPEFNEDRTAVIYRDAKGNIIGRVPLLLP